MEMEYKDGSRRGRIIMLLGVLLAVIAGATAYYLLTQKSTAPVVNVPTVSVVVATKALLPHVPIEKADVTLKVVSADAVVEGALVDPAEVVGQVLAVPVLVGQPIYPSMIASGATAGGFSILGPLETVGPDSESWRAISITIPDDRAVGGTLVAGQTIDIFLTATISVDPALATFGPFITGSSTKIIYQNVLILARNGGMYIIRASLPMAEEISHMTASGSVAFSAVLRPDQDVRWVDATRLGETTYLILQKYGLPIPVVYPNPSGPVPTSPPIVYPTQPPPPATPAPSESPAPSP